MLAEAKEVCPSTTRRMLESGALMIDVREAAEAAAFAFDVIGNQEEFLTGACNALQEGKDFLDRTNLFIGDEDFDIVPHEA